MPKFSSLSTSEFQLAVFLGKQIKSLCTNTHKGHLYIARSKDDDDNDQSSPYSAAAVVYPANNTFKRRVLVNRQFGATRLEALKKLQERLELLAEEYLTKVATQGNGWSARDFNSVGVEDERDEVDGIPDQGVEEEAELEHEGEEGEDEDEDVSDHIPPFNPWTNATTPSSKAKQDGQNNSSHSSHSSRSDSSNITIIVPSPIKNTRGALKRARKAPLQDDVDDEGSDEREMTGRKGKLRKISKYDISEAKDVALKPLGKAKKPTRGSQRKKQVVFDKVVADIVDEDEDDGDQEEDTEEELEEVQVEPSPKQTLQKIAPKLKATIPERHNKLPSTRKRSAKK
ncbi:hypothetical protein ACN47E_002560 [Coniothyrium glycines]